MSPERGKKENTTQIAERLIAPILKERGLTLWDTRFEKEGGGWYLRYFVDKKGGVNIGDLESVSRAVDKLLDEADPIEQSYVLEVSSPGIERELRRDRHFEEYIGSAVRVRLIRPLNGKREFSGRLAAYSRGDIAVITDEGEEINFSKAKAASVRLACDYETGGQDE